MTTQPAIVSATVIHVRSRGRDHAARRTRGAAARRLKKTLERAYAKVPHYRRKFDAAGVKPAASESLADLARFPFTLKTDLRDNYPFGMFAVPRDEVLRLHASSGTTGRPTVVGYTQRRSRSVGRPDGALRWPASARGPATSSTTPMAMACSPAGSALHYGAERLGCTVVPLSGGGTERQVTLMQDFGATCSARRRPMRSTSPRSPRRMGVDIAQAAAALRRVRGRAVERSHAPRPRGAARHQGGGHLRPVGDHRAGRRLRMRRGAERPAWLGGPFPVRSHRSRQLQPLPMGEHRRTRHHDADQRSAADGALSHARHHPAVRRALRLRAHPSAASCGSPAATTTC